MSTLTEIIFILYTTIGEKAAVFKGNSNSETRLENWAN